jgi:hypothetical protein
VSEGVNLTCAARRFSCEAFSQEPINHQLGLDLKLGWCGEVHDCAGPLSLLARNPAENSGCDWRVVDVAIDRGVMRHDLLPQAAKARIKACYGLRVLTIGSKDIGLRYTVKMAPRGSASDLCGPVEALSAASIMSHRTMALGAIVQRTVSVVSSTWELFDNGVARLRHSLLIKPTSRTQRYASLPFQCKSQKNSRSGSPSPGA